MQKYTECDAPWRMKLRPWSGLKKESDRFRGVRRITKSDHIALFERMRAGDETARDEFIEGVIPLSLFLYSRVWKRRINHEDMLGACMIACVRAVDGWNPEISTIGTYLEVIIRNEVTAISRSDMKFKRARLSQRRRLLFDAEDTGFREPFYEVGEDARSECCELMEKLRKESAALDKRLKSILTAKLSGKTFEQIGERIGITKSRVSQLFHKAVYLVRKSAGIKRDGRVAL